MINPFKYTLDNKRYHTFNYYLKTKFNQKASKVPLDAGFSCPNRDGSLSTKGCIYCSKRGSGDYTQGKIKDIVTQYDSNRLMMLRKWPNSLSIPYFQAFTNTYGPLQKIKSMIEPFLYRDEVAAIAIATRADCLEDDKIEYLNSLTDIKEIWVELGLQSSNDQSAKLINRGHNFDIFVDCLQRLKNTNIKIAVHIINGLPYEDESMMLQTINDLKPYRIDGIKIHMLHIIKNTALADMYQDNNFPLLTKEEYIKIVIKQLELLDPKIVIQRITGDPVAQDLIAPTWLLNKTVLINDIDSEMARQDTFQGKYYI